MSLPFARRAASGNPVGTFNFWLCYGGEPDGNHPLQILNCVPDGRKEGKNDGRTKLNPISPHQFVNGIVWLDLDGEQAFSSEDDVTLYLSSFRSRNRPRQAQPWFSRGYTVLQACERDLQCGYGTCCAVSLWLRGLRMCTPKGVEGDECHPFSHKVPFFGKRQHHTCPCLPHLACTRYAGSKYRCTSDFKNIDF